jgi:hypothetical protein
MYSKNRGPARKTGPGRRNGPAQKTGPGQGARGRGRTPVARCAQRAGRVLFTAASVSSRGVALPRLCRGALLGLSRLSRVAVYAADGPVARACSARPVYMACRVVGNTCEGKHKAEARFTPSLKLIQGRARGQGTSPHLGGEVVRTTGRQPTRCMHTCGERGRLSCVALISNLYILYDILFVVRVLTLSLSYLRL